MGAVWGRVPLLTGGLAWGGGLAPFRLPRKFWNFSLEVLQFGAFLYAFQQSLNEQHYITAFITEN